MDERETIFKTTVYPQRERSIKISLTLDYTENYFYCNEKETYNWTLFDLYAVLVSISIRKNHTVMCFIVPFTPLTHFKKDEANETNCTLSDGTVIPKRDLGELLMMDHSFIGRQSPRIKDFLEWFLLEEGLYE